MTDSRPKSPKKTAGGRGKKKPALDLEAIRTLIVSGKSLADICRLIGCTDDYLRNEAIKNPALAEAIAEAREMADNGLEYDKIEILAGQGCTEAQISKALGFGKNYITHRKKNDAELMTALERGSAKGIATITGALFAKASKGDVSAMRFYLINKAGWRDKIDIDTNESHMHFYMEGRPEADDIDSWQQQHTPANKTVQ